MHTNQKHLKMILLWMMVGGCAVAADQAGWESLAKYEFGKYTPNICALETEIRVAPAGQFERDAGIQPRGGRANDQGQKQEEGEDKPRNGRRPQMRAQEDFGLDRRHSGSCARASRNSRVMRKAISLPR